MFICRAALPNEVDDGFRESIAILSENVEDALRTLDQFLVNILFEDEFHHFIV
jgi:hypothetical protein